MSTTNSLYEACKSNDITRVRQLLHTLTKEEVNERGPDNRTALHVAAFYEHTEILKLLLACEHIDRFIPNQWGSLAKDEAPDRLKFLFNEIRTVDLAETIDEFNGFDEESIEWFDTYKNAYRIAYECHNHLRRWLTKVSFARLVEEINNEYINNIDFGVDPINHKKLIKYYMKQAIENNDPTPLIRAYTEKTRFVSKLNEDLALGGSDFRFKISSAMINTVYRDNDPPKDFGEYIFAAILSHHSKLKQFRHYIGMTYRGVNMKKSDLDEYEEGKFILTRTFLSSSTDQTVAQSFLSDNHSLGSNSNYPVICIYHIRNADTAIDVHTISTYPDENEILIIPFTTFKIMSIKKNFHDTSYIELEECVIQKE